MKLGVIMKIAIVYVSVHHKNTEKLAKAMEKVCVWQKLKRNRIDIL